MACRSACSIGLRQAQARRLGRLQELVDGHDVPERGVDGVELGRFLGPVGEAVGQHALRDRARPLQEDGAGVVEPAGGETEAAERDEGVASPVGEPRDSRRRWCGPAPRRDEVGIARRARGASAEPPSARFVSASPPAPAPRPPQRASGSMGAPARVGPEDQHRLPALEVEAEDAGRGQVLDVVEAARPLLLVEEAAVPVGIGRVGAVRDRGDRGHRGVGLEDHAILARDLGRETGSRRSRDGARGSRAPRGTGAPRGSPAAARPGGARTTPPPEGPCARGPRARAACRRGARSASAARVGLEATRAAGRRRGRWRRARSAAR